MGFTKRNAAEISLGYRVSYLIELVNLTELTDLIELHDFIELQGTYRVRDLIELSPSTFE